MATDKSIGDVMDRIQSDAVETMTRYQNWMKYLESVRKESHPSLVYQRCWSIVENCRRIIESIKREKEEERRKEG